MHMKRSASAVWRGNLKEGKGEFSTASKAIQSLPYSFGTRFEDKPGSNPEELIAAAHAACFSMALSGQLGNANMTADSISTTATVTMEKLDAGWTVTSSQLEVVARIPNADKAAFEKAAENAKNGCPISRLLNTKVSMNARLE